MKELDKIIGDLCACIPPEIKFLIKPGSEGAKLLSSFNEKLKRSRREFDAILFFTVCFGILKSGKSTLVNLLAGHEEASPTRFGQDTTIRPCILMAGEEDEIIIFRMKDCVRLEGSDDKEQKCFNAVIDHLRGVIEDEQELSINHHVTIRRERFTRDNVFKAVCDKDADGIEPLITAIRLKNCSDLLRSDIALLDVPGLDSDKMNTEMPRYLELLERCDLLLFVQSTISAFGKGAGSTLKSLVERSKGSPVWLIQNRFEAQPWRMQEELRDRDLELAKLSRNNLAISLSLPEKLIFAKQINLGKAYDARFNKSLLLPDIDSDLLMEESAFAEVEKELSDKINDERLDIQLGNCLKQLLSTVKNGKKDLTQLEEWINAERTRLFAFEVQFDNLIQRFQEKAGFIPIPQNNNGTSRLKDAADEVISNQRDQWKKKVRDDMDHWKSQIVDNYIGDQFNMDMSKIVGELFNIGPKIYFGRTDNFGSSIGAIFKNSVGASENYQKLISDSEETVRNFHAGLLNSLIPDWDPVNTPLYLDVNVPVIDKVKGGRTWYGPKHKIEIATCRHMIDIAVQNLYHAIDQYSKKISDEVDKWFCDYRDNQIAKNFCDQLKERKSNKREEAKKRHDDLEKVAETIPELRKQLENLSDFANRFWSKYNLI